MSYTSSPRGSHSVNRAATHPSLHIRDAHDAHVILEAVRLNVLPLIKRRLIASEREQLCTGNVFVWEEAEDEGGLLRWTDGRRWSQSRMRGDYLFYEEKVETTQEEKDAKAARRARRASDPTAFIPAPTRRKDRPSKPDGLTKQTYSAVVHIPGSKETRKWHVVAYFSGNDYIHLPVIENYDFLRRIRVPDGIFLSSKTLTSRMDRFSYYSDETETLEHDQQNNYPRHHGFPPPRSPTSPSASVSSSSPIPHPLSMPSAMLGADRSQRVALPPLSTLGYDNPLRRRAGSVYTEDPARSPVYAPLSSEDRRVLNQFRLVL